MKFLRSKVPSVAILGYTNSGKTTLIKAITGEAKLEPRDALFATLDVTTHACKLPSNLTTLFVDTVGFICDIPTHLVAAFNATLRDAIDAVSLIPSMVCVYLISYLRIFFTFDPVLSCLVPRPPEFFYFDPFK